MTAQANMFEYNFKTEVFQFRKPCRDLKKSKSKSAFSIISQHLHYASYFILTYKWQGIIYPT